MSNKRIALTALIPAAITLVSCGSHQAPQASLPTTLQAQNTDICPSCGRPALTAWVAPAVAPVEMGDGEIGGIISLIPSSIDPQPLNTGPVVPAAASRMTDLMHLTVITSPDRARPVACFQPNVSLRPSTLPALSFRDADNTVDNTWSGGVVLLSEFVAQASVPTVAAADQVCQSEFGLSWRTLRMNDATDLLPAGIRPVGTWATALL